MIKTVLCLSFLFFGIAGFSQPYIDIADVQYQLFTRAAYKDAPSSNAATSLFKAGVTFPFQMKNGNVILGGFEHLHHHFDYDSVTHSYGNDLYSNEMHIGFKHDMKDPAWNYVVMGIAKINADLVSVRGTDWQAGGAVLFTWKKREALKWKFGLYYNREFFGNYFMALLGIEWKVNKRLNIFGTLPAAMNIEYRLHPKWTAGLAYRSVNSSYRTKDNPGDMYVLEGHKIWADNQISAVINYYPFKNLTAYIGVGQTVFRYFQTYNSIHIKTSADPSLLPFKNQQFVYFGLAFRVRFDQEKN